MSRAPRAVAMVVGLAVTAYVAGARAQGQAEAPRAVHDGGALNPVPPSVPVDAGVVLTREDREVIENLDLLLDLEDLKDLDLLIDLEPGGEGG